MMATRDTESFVDGLARLGYTAKGVIWVMIGMLAAGVAFGVGGQTTGSDGVFKNVLAQPLGRTLLAVLAAGLAAYAVWRLIEAAIDPSGRRRGFKGAVDRVGIAINGAAHALLTVEAVRLILGEPGGPGDNPERWTGKVLAWSYGVWLVGAVGLVIVAVAAGQLYKAFYGNVARELGLGEADPEDRRWIVRLGRVGKAVSSAIFGIAGYLLLRAALTYDAEKAAGVGDVLVTIRDQPYSRVLLAVVAAGLVAHGGFHLVIARYRRIRLPSSGAGPQLALPR